MKLITSLTLGLLTATSLFAQTTMCFKENHSSMVTIESIALDGGLCSSSKSVQDMKNEGWNVDDIKIEKSSKGNNYIYIFKKESISSMDEEKLEQRIMQRLEQRKEEEKAARIVQIKEKMSKNGRDIYINTCQRCHGQNADIKAYGTARPLVSLNLNDFQQALRDYRLGDYNRGSGMVMRPYAKLVNTKKAKDIYSYIKTLKPKENKKEEEAK